MQASRSFFGRLLMRFMRFFFRLLYGKMAWTYDLVAATVSLGLWKTWVFSVIPFITGERILEIGHGPGHLQAELWHRGFHPKGLDASPQMSRLARSRLGKTNENASCLCINGYAQFIPFTMASFDHVISTFPSEYIFDGRTLAEIYRVLSPGGRFIYLPGAWITDRTLPYRLAAGLFRITNQSPPHAAQLPLPVFTKPLIDTGFLVSTQLIDLPHSQALIILADKPEQQSF